MSMYEYMLLTINNMNRLNGINNIDGLIHTYDSNGVGNINSIDDMNFEHIDSIDCKTW